MPLETVDDLINRVDRAHPRLSPAGQIAFFEAVHQELAPLARRLEHRVAELEAELRAQADIHRKQWRDAAAAAKHRLETSCPKNP